MQGRALQPQDHERGRILSAVVGLVHINLYPECALPCLNDFRDKQGVVNLMMGALRLYTVVYLVYDKVISAAVGLVYINLQPEYQLPNSTRFGHFQKFKKKLSWGHCPPARLKKILHGV